MDEHEKKALDNINKYGCHILHVFEEGELPRFTYSIGIEKTSGQSDIIIMGLRQKLAHWIINEYKERVKQGEVFEQDKYYSGFLKGFDVTFKEVSIKYYQEHFGWGIWYNNGYNFKMLQLIFPDVSGVWPWEESASNDFKQYQPLLV